MAKTLDENFIDWEASAFGFGYGTGEPHVLGALKSFFDLIGVDRESPRSYDYNKLEAAFGAPVTWLLINALCRHDIIEYGTSPRFGWLTAEGEALKAFVDSKTVDELVDLVCSTTQDSIICHPNACNCGAHGYEEGRVCVNPFWPRHGAVRT